VPTSVAALKDPPAAAAEAEGDRLATGGFEVPKASLVAA